jgi:putative ABC transport system ATP-binding protein
MSIVTAKRLGKDFAPNGRRISVLREVSLEVSAGETVALTGPSGSGKSTLLSLLAGLDRPTSGEIELDGSRLNEMSEDELAELRSEKIGFVFQSFQLIGSLTALENVMVPAEIRGDRRARQRAAELLSAVGLEERLTHYPSQLSGGEQQRVAIARAYINQPKILFADEPTGSLDHEHAASVKSLLFSLRSDHGSALVIATHNLELARETDRRIELANGIVCEG